MKFSIVSIVGRSGAGKGTQVKLLQEKTGFEVVRTGDILRKRTQKRDAVGKRLKEVLDEGGLVPTPIVFSLWMPKLEEIKNKGKTRGIIFDGNPRKKYEAQMLKEVFGMFGWEGRFRAVYLRITEKVALWRLLERRRYDDTPVEVRGRMEYFKKEVIPMLNYYRKEGVLIEINGMQKPSEAHKEIMRKLKEFLK